MSNVPTSDIRHLTSSTAITLVALTITIIVLLILAGVTLAILLGDNGVIGKARKARENTNKAVAIEDVKLAWSQIRMEYETRTGEEETKQKAEYYTKENVQSKLKSGTIAQEEGSFVYKEDGTSKVVYENERKEKYIIEIDENGNTYIKENSEVKPDDEFVTSTHKVTITKGENYQITTSSELTWESENESIATVVAEETKATITGTNPGETKITAKNKNGTTAVECNITVLAKSEEFVSTAHTVTINKGSTYQITSSSNLTWTSANTNIATIKNESGKVVVTGVNAGTSKIIGKNGNGTTVVECNITVFQQSAYTYVWKVYGVNSSNIYGYTMKSWNVPGFCKKRCLYIESSIVFNTRTRYVYSDR